MTYEQEFLKDFEEWVVTQVKVNETALAASKKIWEEDGDERARDASFRYEAKLDAYNFLIGKFTIIVRVKVSMICQMACSENVTINRE